MSKTFARIQVRRDTAANWTFINPVLSDGEPAYETDSGREKTGDGATAWIALPYKPVLEEVALLSSLEAEQSSRIAADTALQNNLNSKEDEISTGTTSQYWRGDKSWQTLDKSAVGLSNVDNTADANKPVSTAQQAAIDSKENAFSKNSAFNKDFGTGTTNIPAIGTTLSVSQNVESDGTGKLITVLKSSAFNKDFGTGTTNIPAIGSPLFPSQNIETDGTGKLITFPKATAFNKDFGVGSSNIPAIGTTLGTTQNVETDSSGKLITAVKASAFNKDFGTTSGTITQGNDSRLNDTRIPKLYLFGRSNFTAPNDTNENCVASMLVPNGNTTVVDEFLLKILLSRSGAGSPVTVRFRLHLAGGTPGSPFSLGSTMGSFPIGTTGLSSEIDFRWVNKNSFSIQEAVGAGMAGPGPSNSAIFSSIINTSNDWYVVITVQKGTGSDGAILNNFSLLRWQP